MEIPNVDSSIGEFITKADNAMYAAKNSGRNRICQDTGPPLDAY